MKRRIPRAPRSWAAAKRVFLSSLLLLLGLVLVLTPRQASADDPELSAAVDTKRLAVGDVLRLSLHVSSKQHQPEAPSPGPTPGFTVVGSSSGPSQEVTISGGRVVVQRGLDAAWNLRADKVGTWSIGPVSVRVGGATYRAGPVQITVVPAGQGPRRPPDPLDPFGGPFDPFRGLLDSFGGQQHDLPGEDPKLALDAPRGSIAFLHATIDATDVVVGQQVTVAMYLYVDVTARDPGMVDIHEATAADFVKKTLFEDDNNDRPAARAVVGDRVYNVRLLRKWALFPIRTGDLVVSPMEMTLQKNRSIGDPSRKSEVLTVHVTEPPMAHRPPGYVLGDVGKFSLSADTAPREIEEDGAVGVTLTLQGTGNLPAMVTPPAQAGLEWLTPEVHEKIGPMPGAGQGDVFGGQRTFTYVLRIHKTGEVRLGSISLPFWDPSTQRYDVARADLGTVAVKPSKTPKAERDAPPDPFTALPDVRTQMGLTRGARGALAETHPALFWMGLGAAPLAFVVFSSVSFVVRRTRERIRERALSPETDLKAKLAAAERAAKGDDARSLSAATARALEAATLVYRDVNVRDARADEARGRLVLAGLSEALAAEVGSVLGQCEEARFSPEPPELSLARSRWEKARGAIEAMRREA